MKFKFKPQTGILVAGVLAATYAQACFYQQTQAVCVLAGSTVDSITWQDGNPTQRFVTASADWIVNAQGGHYLVVSGSGPYGNYGDDGGSLPAYCSGAVHFKDGAGNTVSVSSWYGGSTDPNGYPKIDPGSKGIFAGTGDGTCE